MARQIKSIDQWTLEKIVAELVKANDIDNVFHAVNLGIGSTKSRLLMKMADYITQDEREKLIPSAVKFIGDSDANIRGRHFALVELGEFEAALKAIEDYGQSLEQEHVFVFEKMVSKGAPGETIRKCLKKITSKSKQHSAIVLFGRALKGLDRDRDWKIKYVNSIAPVLNEFTAENQSHFWLEVANSVR